ncbi:MAG: response regulator [Candidatus Aminicenantes bacterium]|jgi:DNA-binding response OmpR family regulator|nr:response regulator [Candidatus Aminicenantes bacterium]
MKKILLVEDEKALSLLYEEELEREGYEVVVAYDAESALEQIRKEKFDLIITDIRMPGRDGIELIASIMGLRKDIPIIINTAYQSYKDDFMTWAADAYLIKSSSLDELKNKIKELLEKSSS